MGIEMTSRNEDPWRSVCGLVGSRYLGESRAHAGIVIDGASDNGGCTRELTWRAVGCHKG